MNRRIGLIATIFVVFFGCEIPQEPLPISDQPLAEIVDGANNGREGFYFLPPMVRHPAADGVFDPDFLPFLTVSICEIAEGECVGDPIEQFTEKTGRIFG